MARVSSGILAGAALLLAWSSCAAGETVSRQFGDWELEMNTTVIEATTRNASGSVFGYVCFAASCRYYINAGIECEDGASIAVLMNSASGSRNTQLDCVAMGDEYFTFLPYRDVEESAASGSVLGFAVPMTDGAFKALRFSLDGYAEAVAAAEKLVGMLQQPAGDTVPAARDNYF